LDNGGCYVTAKSGINGVPRNSVNGISNKFKEQAKIYRLFAKDWEKLLDFSDAALLSLYNHESYGTKLSEKNGFAVGKKFLNVQVTMWKEDLDNHSIFKWELYEDDRFPHWWLDSVLSNKTDLKTIMEARPKQYTMKS